MEKHVQDLLKTDLVNIMTEKEKQKDENRTIFVTRWHPKLYQLQSILKNHHYIIGNDEWLNKIFTTYPLVAFKKAKSIANHLIKNNYSPKESQHQNNNTEPCKNCSKTCHLMSNKNYIKKFKNR